MAQEYVLIKDKSDAGMIALNKSIFESIAEISIDEIENAEKIPTTRFSKPIQVKIQKNKLHINADIKVNYGANVNATCELVQNKIYENVLLMTSFKATEIGVNVIGFKM